MSLMARAMNSQLFKLKTDTNTIENFMIELSLSCFEGNFFETEDVAFQFSKHFRHFRSYQQIESLSIKYPVSGTGAVVTFVQVLITQDNGTTGRGYVVAGGIGSRYIQLIVEAWNTAYIRYDILIYGV